MSGIKTRSDKMKKAFIEQTANSTSTVIITDSQSKPKPQITIIDLSNLQNIEDLGYKFTVETKGTKKNIKV